MRPTLNALHARDHARMAAPTAAARTHTAAGEWDRAAEAWSRFRKRAERHMAIEESLLFPAVQASLGLLVSPLLVRDHVEIRERASALAVTLAEQAQASTLRHLDELGALIDDHERRERAPYAWLDLSLSDSQRAALHERLRDGFE